MSQKKRVRERPTPLPFGHDGPCHLLKDCAACPLLPLSYEAQLTWKHNDLNTHLLRYPLLNLSQIHVLQAQRPQPALEGYRHTVKPSVRAGEDDQAPLRIGLYQPGTHQLINLSECLVQTTALNALLESIRVLAPQVGLCGYRPGDESHLNQSRLRYIIARQGETMSADDESTSQPSTVYLTLVLTTLNRDKVDQLIDKLKECNPCLVGVSVHINQLSGNAIFDQEQPTRHHWGVSTLYARFRPLPSSPALAIQLSASSFAQVNPEVAEAAYQSIVHSLDPQPGDTVVDVYCGVGSIGLLLAARARENGGALTQLYGLEETSSSLIDAEHNAQRLKIDEAQFILGRAENTIGTLLEARLVNDDRHMLVALNPSRRGCQPEVLRAITDLKPRQIAYMSCHAKSLSRDLNRLAERGYFAESITLFDMFPGSAHYETVSILSPR